MIKKIFSKIKAIYNAYFPKSNSNTNDSFTRELTNIEVTPEPVFISIELIPTTSDFADRFIRGLTDKNMMFQGICQAHAFYFKYEEKKLNSNEQYENSINWYDDQNAMTSILTQKREKDDSIQFKEGAVVVPLTDLIEVCKLPNIKGHLKYERHKIPGNIYHGNLLLHKSVDKKLMQIIAANISIRVVEYVPNPNA